MKTITIKHIALSTALLIAVASCKQEQLKLVEPTTPTPTTPAKGNLDFTKFISLGNSLTSGFQAGALFTDGQNNSFPKILSTQFSLVQGTTLTFNQPDINSVNGYNATYSNPPSVILGRLFLYAADTIQADAVPTPAGAYLPAATYPYNSADMIGAYTGNKAALNNFGVPGILVAHLLAPQVGSPTTGNPYYARFASNPGVSTILHDAIATKPTFFTFDLGNNDVLGYAVSGGDGSTPITPLSSFQTYYSMEIDSLLTKTSANGVLTTIPDVTTIPFFTTITWNYVQLDTATGASIQKNLANNYNAFLQAMVKANVIAASEAAARTLTFITWKNAVVGQNAIKDANTGAIYGQNAILITDQTLTDLTQAMQANGASSLVPYAQARQATSSDLIPLSAGAVLGKPANPNDPTTIQGVAVPLADKYALIPIEIDSITTATTGFNSFIKNYASNSRLAVADINKVLSDLVTNGFAMSNYITLKATFAPPFGAFSEDGIHLNSRGYAFMANAIIDAINNKSGWGANVPPADISQYSGTGLPYGPNGLIQ